MKKYLTLVFAILLVFMAACGGGTSENTSKTDSDNKNEAADKEDTESKEQEDEAPEDDDEYSFDNEIGHFDMVGAYASEDISEEGFYNIDFDGFLLDLSASLVDIELSEEAQYEEKYEGKDSVRAILLSMFAENTTDNDVDFNGTTTVVTSDGEQLSADYGIMSENEAVQTYFGKVKEEGYFIIPLKNDDSVPDDIEILMDPPYIVEDGAVDPVNGALGEEQRFTLDFYSKEDIEEGIKEESENE